MRPISKIDLQTLGAAGQYFSDCYLLSSIGALSRCENGQRILKQNIQREGNDFFVKFNNVNGKAENYFVSAEECKQLVEQKLDFDTPTHEIINAVEVAMDKLIKAHPDKKSFISKLLCIYEIDKLRRFESNFVSNFLEMFTGIKPLTLNEKTLRMTLKKHQSEATGLMYAMGECQGSFVFGTGYKRHNALSNFHCYEMVKSHPQLEQVEITEHRDNKIITLNYREVINNFKYICGYFDNMLAPKSEVLK